MEPQLGRMGSLTTSLVLGCVGAMLLCPLGGDAATRASALYSTAHESTNPSGSLMTSAAYSIQASLGGLGSVTQSATTTFIKPDFVGQIFEISEIQVTSFPNPIDEAGTGQVSAVAILDDASILELESERMAWSVTEGPIATITPSGFFLTTTVFTDSPATIEGEYANQSAETDFVVANVGNDDLGLYAGDGLSDDWQTLFFGTLTGNETEHPTSPSGSWQALSDPDLDGRTNLFEYALGLNPIASEATENVLASFVVEELDGHHVYLRFMRRKNAPDIRYVPEVSIDQVIWTASSDSLEEVEVIDVDEAFEQVTVKDKQVLPDGGACYCRLRITTVNSLRTGSD